LERNLRRRRRGRGAEADYLRGCSVFELAVIAREYSELVKKNTSVGRSF